MSNLTVDIIRHGEPVGGARYRGYGIDDPLSEKGWEQMWSAVGAERPWRYIVTSPLRRCREFSEKLAESCGVSVSVVDALKEVGFGSWEGKTKAELREIDEDAFRRFYQDPVRERPAGAERLEDFIIRVQSAFHDIVAEAVHEHILIVAHAGVVRAILAGVLGLEPAMMYRVNIRNAGIMRIVYSDGEGHLEWLNGAMQ